MYGEDRMRGRGARNAPVKVGEELDVKIEAVGEKGDGIAKVNGFVLFVPNVKEGQSVKIKITRVLSKVGFAEVVGEGAAGEAAEPAAEEEPAYQGEDTEDFGEEAEEKKEGKEEAGESAEPAAEEEPEQKE